MCCCTALQQDKHNLCFKTGRLWKINKLHHLPQSEKEKNKISEVMRQATAVV